MQNQRFSIIHHKFIKYTSIKVSAIYDCYGGNYTYALIVYVITGRREAVGYLI